MAIRKEIRTQKCGCVVDIRIHEDDDYVAVMGRSKWCAYAGKLYSQFNQVRGDRQATEAISAALRSHALDD